MNDESEQYHLDNSDSSDGYDFGAFDTGIADDARKHEYRRATNAVSDETYPIEHDGRSVTKTGFNPNDVPVDEGRHHWEWLNKLNDGYGASERKEQNRNVNRHRDAEAFMSELECSEYQQQRVLYLLDSHEGGSMGGTTSEELLILGLISMVVDRDEMSTRTIRDEQQWDELRSALDVPQWKIGQVRDLLDRRGMVSNKQTGGALHI